MFFPRCKNTLVYVCDWESTLSATQRAYSAPQSSSWIKDSLLLTGKQGRENVPPNKNITTTPLFQICGSVV